MRTMLLLVSTIVMFTIGTIVLVMIIVLQLLIYFTNDESTDLLFEEQLPPHFNLALGDPLVLIVSLSQFAVLNTNWKMLNKQKHP